MKGFFSQFPRLKQNYRFPAGLGQQQIIDLFRFIRIDDTLEDDLSTYAYYEIQNGDRPDVVSSILYNTPEYYWTFFIINDHLREGGLSHWPLSTEAFSSYIEGEYGSAAQIDTYPIIVRDGNGIITDHRNSLANRYQIGENVIGSISGATGVLRRKDTQMSSMVIDITSGSFQTNEQIVGQTTYDEVTSYRVTDYRDGIKYWLNSNGEESYNARSIDEGNVQPGTSESELTGVTHYQYEVNLNEERSRIRIIKPELIYNVARIYREMIKKN